MATIKVSENVRVRGLDPKSWTVELRHEADPDGRGGHLVRHAGQERWVGLGYHGSVVMAARQALEVSLRLEPGEYDLAGLARLLDETVDRIVQAAEPKIAQEFAAQVGQVEGLPR